MARPAGIPKTGGRSKGTPNKRTLAFSETLSERGIDVLGEILTAAADLSERDRANIYLNLLPYQYPKRKPTDAPFSINDYLDQLPQNDLEMLYHGISTRLGYNKHVKDITLDGLYARRALMEKAIKLMEQHKKYGDTSGWSAGRRPTMALSPQAET